MPPPEQSQPTPAKELVPPKTTALQARILSFIRSCGTIGSTSEEAEVTLGLPHQTVSARLTELQRERLIRKATRPGTRMDEAPVPVKRKTRTGRNAQVWIACD